MKKLYHAFSLTELYRDYFLESTNYALIFSQTLYSLSMMAKRNLRVLINTLLYQSVEISLL